MFRLNRHWYFKHTLKDRNNSQRKRTACVYGSSEEGEHSYAHPPINQLFSLSTFQVTSLDLVKSCSVDHGYLDDLTKLLNLKREVHIDLWNRSDNPCLYS